MKSGSVTFLWPFTAMFNVVAGTAATTYAKHYSARASFAPKKSALAEHCSHP